MKCALFIVAAAILIAKSFALECYVCDSETEFNCHDMYDRNVRSENCDSSRLPGFQTSVCLKTVSFEYGNRRTVRTCARAGPKRDPCHERHNAVDLSVCDMCDSHLCNGSLKRSMNIFMALLPLTLIMIKIF